jgi:shikimate dehydrogenase
MNNFQRINRDTKFFGILGFPLSHTLSPIIHNTLFSEYKQNAVYLVLEKEYPDKFILFRERGLIKISGVSVTIPHKEWAYQISDESDASGDLMQASNTLVQSEEGHIRSFNTDGLGAIKAIEEHKSNLLTSTGSILILGSGGSARGISFELLKNGYSGNLIISARNEETGKALVSALNQYKSGRSFFVKLDQLETADYSLIINTTPVGMKGNSQKSLLHDGFFTKKTVLFDIVYNPFLTPLVKQAKKAGSKIIPGYDMLLYQAMEQFKIFTGNTVLSKHVNHVRKLITNSLNLKV